MRVRVLLAEDPADMATTPASQHAATMSSCYAHQSRLGTSLTQGQVIDCVGSTGNSFGAHLHFEVRVNGTPVDPTGYL